VNKVDYIIVGFGLAGAALALELRKRGQKVMIFDTPYPHQASRVAAGLFNPITGKVMSLTWNAKQIFPRLHDFYREAEELTGGKFFYPKPICIPFLTAEEQNNWMTKSGMEDFIQEVYTGSRYSEFVNDRFGGVVLKGSGFVDTVRYLDGVRDLFVNERSFIEKPFENDIDGTVIYCEGTRVLDNPLFNWVPVNPLKGETIEVELTSKPPHIFNRGVYMVPLDGSRYRVGATYSHDRTEGPTEAGKTELTRKLDALLTIPYTVTNHNWGTRPTTPDRKPILGRHPDHKNIWIFNGLGTKGVSLAPWASGMLCDTLTKGFQIDAQVNITRFYALYSKFRD
jgi:glycine/D-amino acid oxidase-like deaminating enzyme